MCCVCCLYGGCLRCGMSCVVVYLYWDDICTPYNVRRIIYNLRTMYGLHISSAYIVQYIECIVVILFMLYVYVCCMYDWCYMGGECCTCDVDGAVCGICV